MTMMVLFSYNKKVSLLIVLLALLLVLMPTIVMTSTADDESMLDIHDNNNEIDHSRFLIDTMTSRSLSLIGVNLSYDNIKTSPRYGGIGIKCSNNNSSYNPCGPDGICTDTTTGYSCTSIIGSTTNSKSKYFNDCVTGCGPNSYCITVSATRRKMCICSNGFYRKAIHLPCIRKK